MTRRVKLAGVGVTTAQGKGQENNLQAMAAGQGLYRTRKLDIFDEPVEVPYLSIESLSIESSSVENSSVENLVVDSLFVDSLPKHLNLKTNPTRSTSTALNHLESLLDSAVDEALSGIVLSEASRRTMPLFIGSSSYGIGVGEALYQRALEQGEAGIPLPLDGFTQVGNHLRHHFRLMGPDYAYNTACTGSANAILSAISVIAQGRSQYAMVIGLESYNMTTLAGFYGMQLLAPEVMRPFDKRRQGLVLGEGCGVLLLQAAGAADTGGITLSGGASRCDTHSIAASNPDGSAIAAVMEAALAQCGLNPDDIIAIKAHGTGSPLNDDGEVAGMKRVFREVPPFFSLKSYIGHTLGGCGAIETALTAMSLGEHKIPASAGFECRDENLGLAPICQAQSVGQGYYMLNFFGFGGNNCSLIIHAQ